MSQGDILAFLRNTKNPASITDLATALNHPKNTISILVKKLELSGRVSSERIGIRREKVITLRKKP